MAAEEHVLEFTLATKFENVPRFYIPEVTRAGCFESVRDTPLTIARNEGLRQEYLNRLNTTDEQIMDDILFALKKKPSLARQKYKNFGGQDMLPLWYFVLSGGDREKVEQVFSMYPEALFAPLREEFTDQGVEVFTLLQAACGRSLTSDDVLAFLAKECSPEHLVTRFHYEPLPFSSRVIDLPRHDRVRLASLQVIQALAPPGSWNLPLFNDLISLGYNVDVLQYALDMILHDNNQLEGNDGSLLNLSGPFEASRCLLDEATAHELERLLGTDASTKISTFHCMPQLWTREGFTKVLRLVQMSNSIDDLTIQIQDEKFRGNDRLGESDLAFLEDVFATNSSIQTLRLKVDEACLEAIVNGITRGWKEIPRRRQLALTLEVTSWPKNPPDVTGSLVRLINQGFLETLHVERSFYHLKINLISIWSALRQDNTLKAIEMHHPLLLPVNKEDDNPLLELLSLLKSNVTLEQVVLYDRRSRVDYTGFTKCPNEIKPNRRFHQPKVHDEALGEEIMHYLRLNRCNRKQIRKEGTSKEGFVAVLIAAREKLASVGIGDADLKHFNVVFALLSESPGLWSW